MTEPLDDNGVDAAVDMFNAIDAAAPAAPAPIATALDPREEESSVEGDADPGAPPPALPEMPIPQAPDIGDVPAHVVRKGDKAIATWKQLHSELETAQSSIADMARDRELTELRVKELEEQLGKVPKPEDLEAANKRAEQLEDTLGKIDVTQSKRFKEVYDKPINEVFGKVVHQFMKAGSSQDDAIAKARSIFKPGMQDPQALAAALEDESSLVVGAVSALLDEREQLAVRREEAIANWRQEQAAEAEDRVRRDAATIGDQLSKAAQSGFARAVKEGSWLFKPGADPKWNERVKVRREAVMGFIRGGKPEELAYLVAEGVASPTYRKAYERMRAQNEDLKAQIAAISGTRPGMGAGSRPASAPAAAAPAAPATLGEAVDQLWGDAGPSGY